MFNLFERMLFQLLSILWQRTGFLICLAITPSLNHFKILGDLTIEALRSRIVTRLQDENYSMHACLICVIYLAKNKNKTIVDICRAGLNKFGRLFVCGMLHANRYSKSCYFCL